MQKRQGIGGDGVSSAGEKRASDDHVTIPVVEEEVVIGKSAHEGDTVSVTKSKHTDYETVEVPIEREEVEVERMPVGKVIHEPAVARQEGPVTIIPVMEEVVKVTKHLVLKEEIRLIRKKSTTVEKQEIELQKEVVEIRRVKPQNS